MLTPFNRVFFAFIGLAFATANYADTAPSAPQTKPTYNSNTNNFTYNAPTAQPSTPDWAGLMGLIVGIGPKYPGSDATMLMGGATFNISYKNRIFLNGSQGLGVNIINTGPFTFGTSLLYGSINAFRNSEFSGLSNAPSAFTGSIFGNYTISLFNFGLSAYKTIGTLEGAGYYRANAVAAIPVNHRTVLNISASAQYDDGNYFQAYYGVTSQESIASGLPAYQATSGWDNIAYSISPMISISRHWIVAASLGAQTFLGQAAKSPIIQRQTNVAAGIGIIYNFF
jgi:outer membrane protein